MEFSCLNECDSFKNFILGNDQKQMNMFGKDKYLYLWNSSLQLHIVNRQRRCVEHGHHHYQHVGSAGGAL